MSLRVDVQATAGALSLAVAFEAGPGPLALIGPNGGGKTTLLRVLAGAHRPASGRIEVGDLTLLDTARGIDRPSERRRVGYVPQGYGLFPHLRVIDNVAFGLSTGPRQRPRAERHQRARAAL
ncbi:MAG: ATP-binding cassette domain-containing protein, partial [Myxococcales bacterium]|nr:ATP-binding cassette domain-containing protein [Myxococcales bacterium]